MVIKVLLASLLQHRSCVSPSHPLLCDWDVQSCWLLSAHRTSSTQSGCCTSNPSILTLLSNKENFQNSSSSFCKKEKKRAPRRVPEQVQILLEYSELTTFSWMRWLLRAHGFLQHRGGKRHSCAQRHGKAEGGGGEQGEREQSVNILTGTHKEPVLTKNLIQD